MLSRFILAAVLVSLAVPAYAIHRDGKVIAEFKRENPCPSTGKRRGKCPGYDVDHVIQLKCGGPAALGNLQWLTKQAHKEKTAREAKDCRKSR
jgi:5-methylcytosine-specific restriction endonuclease McrA